MINRVRKYALKHGISLKEFRKTVMEFKAKSRVTGEEFHPKNIFKIIKDKIEQIKRGKLFYYQIIISVTITFFKSFHQFELHKIRFWYF